MKKILPIFTMIWPYATIGFFKYAPVYDWPFWYFIALELFFISTTAIGAIVNADDPNITRWNMIIKIVHVPYYIIMLAMGFMGVLITFIPIPGLLLVGPFFAIIIFGSNFFLLCMSALYGISYMITHNPVKHILRIVFHCLFVVDVFAAISLRYYVKKQEK